MPESGYLSQQLLIKRLAVINYTLAPDNLALFAHKHNSVAFVLMVDDFGVKYTHRADAEHLIASLKKNYKITVDWDGNPNPECPPTYLPKIN